MPVTDCPECDCQLAGMTGRDVADGTVREIFECPECGHRWSVPILNT